MNAQRNDLGRTPVYLSAFVYPGVGQFVQKRWLAGAVLLTTFTIAVVILFINVLTPLFHNLKAVLDWAEHPADTGGTMIRPTIESVVVPFVLAVLIYMAGLADAIRANRPKPPPPVPPA